MVGRISDSLIRRAAPRRCSSVAELPDPTTTPPELALDAATTGATAATAALERRAKHVIYPALRSYLEPPTSLAEAGAVLKIASTASLYRVFERC